MSIFGTMKTAVSGMSAQANRLGTVGDNIANSGTIGYKRASTAFSSMVLPSTAGGYSSGGVQTNIRYSIAEQGGLTYTTSNKDLAIQGNGFFIVQDTEGTPFLTRAGSFTVTDEGNLRNSAGFLLVGAKYGENGEPPVVQVNSLDGDLVDIIDEQGGLSAVGSTAGALTANLNNDQVVFTGVSPSDNTANSTSDYKTSLTAYDSLGKQITYDLHFTKTAGDKWTVAVFDKATADPTTGGFPYGASGSAPLSEIEMTFNTTTGAVMTLSEGGVDLPTLSFDLPHAGGGTIKMDLGGMSQLSTKTGVSAGKINGSPPSTVKDVEISSTGVVSAIYTDGTRRELYQLMLANVPSPDNLKPYSGNVYGTTNTSGETTTGLPGESGFGGIVSGAVENSNVDIANELTEMIEAQRVYTANSKVFQTGSDLMDVLINLKR